MATHSQGAHSQGTLLTCAHGDCGCRVRIEVECHCDGPGESYVCICGDRMVEVADPAAEPGP